MSPSTFENRAATLLIGAPLTKHFVTETEYESRVVGTELYTLEGVWNSKTRFTSADGMTYEVTEDDDTDYSVSVATSATLWLVFDGERIESVGQIHSIEWKEVT